LTYIDHRDVKPAYYFTMTTLHCSASEMTYIVSGGALNYTHSLTLHCRIVVCTGCTDVVEHKTTPPCWSWKCLCRDYSQTAYSTRV